MERKILFVVVVLLLLAIASTGAAVTVAGQEMQTLTITLPKGDVKAGMVAFRSLGCFSCHALSGKEGRKIHPVSATTPAPLLDSRLAKMNPSELATSIIAPSHKVSSVIAEQSGGKLSPMGDFSDVMTVRQLADLIAYLQSLTED